MSKDSSTPNAKQLREDAVRTREEAKKLQEQSRVLRKKKSEDVNQAAFRIVRESTENS